LPAWAAALSGIQRVLEFTHKKASQSLNWPALFKDYAVFSF